ncbi:Vitamin B12 transporter BtuB [Thalassocella blandensis]|nr:Vitamin B12 transporter BtuB [Thalassocella blandensis]
MKHPAILGLAIMSIANPSYVIAQEQEHVIVTGVYSPLATDYLSASVSVLDRQQLTQLNKTRLPDILQTIPGLLIEQQGGPGGLTAVSIRGGESNYTVVMVDGVALNDPGNTRGGSFDLSNIDVDSIERIEVVKGPQSAIYGSDALSGVINIITRRPEEGHQTNITAGLGEEGYQKLGFSALGKTGNMSYTIQMRGQNSGETVKGSESDHRELQARMEWQPSAQHSLAASYRLFSGERSTYPEQSGGPEHAQSDALDTTDYDDESAAITWQYHITQNWRSQLQATVFNREEQYESPGIAPYAAVPANGADSDFTRSQISWTNTLGQIGRYWANLGVVHRSEEGDSEGYLNVGVLMPTDFSLERDINSAFVDLNGQVNERLLLQGSWRYDDSDQFDSESTFKIGLRWQLIDSISLSANAGEGYKLPSFFALGHPLVGNPDLLPERADSWDLGMDWQISSQWNTGLTYFSNEFTDLIDFDAELFTNVNRKQIDTSGAEWKLQWSSPNNHVQFHAHATYTDIDVINENSVLTGRPDWQAGTSLSWALNNTWRFAGDLQWVGEQYATSQHTGDVSLHELDAYTTLAASAFYTVTEQLELNLAVENMLDEEYQTAYGFPAPGRLMRLAMSFQF